MGIIFLYPTFLWSLFLVSIPIVIHLFNFRKYKTVYFSNVSLLKEVEQESKKTRTVKNWLILLLRILAVVFLVLAFAYPIEKKEGRKGEKIVSLYIDNSFSMDANGLDGNKFNLAKYFADKIVTEFESNTKFQIITNDFLAKHQFFYSKDKALDLISEISISNKTKTIQSVLKRQLSLISEQENIDPNIYLISDFQGLEDSTLFNPDSIPVSMCLISSEGNKNVGVDSVWFESPVRARFGNEEINVKITNFSSEAFKALPIQLSINGKITQQIVALKANYSETFPFVYRQPKDSIVEGKVFIEDANLVFDNALFFSYPLQAKTKVYVISDSKDFISVIDKLFSNDSTIKYQNVKSSNIDFSALEKQNLIILGEINQLSSGLIAALKNASDKGTNLAVFPSGSLETNDYKDLSFSFGGFQLGPIDTVGIQIESVLSSHSFFNNVFEKDDMSVNTKKEFPILKRHFPIILLDAEPLIFKTDGTPYLIKSNNLYFFSAGITSENSELKNHALVVPIFYQLVFNAVKSARIQYFTDTYINIKTPVVDNNALIEIKNMNQSTYKTHVFADGGGIVLPANFQKEGHYTLQQNSVIKEAFGVNNNRLESKEINQQIINVKSLSNNNPSCKLYYASSENIENILNESLNSRSYWKLLLIAAFICLFLEMLIIRILGR